MRIFVTNENIMTARKKLQEESGNLYTHCCPIALACKELGLSNVSVGRKTLSSIQGEAFLPEIATEFIRQFDNDQAVYPIVFDVDLLPRDERLD